MRDKKVREQVLLPNKRSQAQIIVTVLIILLVIAAIAIVSVVIMNLVRQQTGTAEQRAACLDVQLLITSAVDGENEVTVRREVGGGEVSGVTVIVDDAATKATKATNSTGSMAELQSVVLGLNATLNSGDTVNAAATIEIEGEEFNCGVKATKVVQ
jgi:hypothetical protein